MSPELVQDVLRRLMVEQGLTQDEVTFRAARAGHHLKLDTLKSYLRPAMRGRVPDADQLEAMAAGLGVDPTVFYEWPIAEAKRAARPTVTERARVASRRLADTPPTSRRTRRAPGGGGQGS